MTPKAQKNLEYTLVTHKIEDLRPSNYAISLCKRMAEGEITADEAVDAILKYHKVSGSTKLSSDE